MAHLSAPADGTTVAESGKSHSNIDLIQLRQGDEIQIGRLMVRVI